MHPPRYTSAALLVMAGAVAWRPVVAQHDAAADADHVTVSELKALVGISNLGLSSDGANVVFGQAGRVLVLSTERGGTPRDLAAGSRPIWSPSGTAIAFYAPDPAGVHQIFTAEIATGRVRQLTDLEQGVIPDGMSWSTTGRIVFQARPLDEATRPAAEEALPTGAMSEEPREPAPMVLEAGSPDGYALAGIFPGVGEPRGAEPIPSAELFVYTLASGETRQLTFEGAGYREPTWSPDGTVIACVSQQGLSRGFQRSGVYLVDARTGAARLMAQPEDPRKSMPVWSPDGRRLAFAEYSGTDTREHGVTVLTLEDGHVVASNRVFREPVDNLAWSADGGSLVATAMRSVTKPVVEIALDDGVTRIVGASEHVATTGTLTTSAAGVTAWAESRGDLPVAIQVLRAGADAPEELYDPNAHLRDRAFGHQEIVRWRNGFGEAREGILITPPSDRPGPYPLIVSAYSEGSHQNGFQSSTWPGFGNQALASLGYAVFFPGPRVPWMYGGATSSAPLSGPDGWELTVDDVESGVDRLIERGVADPDRLAIMGFSNGGAAATAVITESDRYRAAIVLAPANLDWLQLALLSDDIAQRFAPTRKFVGVEDEVWEDPEAYVRGSPIFRLDRVTTPVLLGIGDRDYPSFLLPTLQMYLVLRRLERPVTLVRYPAAGHGFFGSDADDLNGRILTFLAEHIGLDGGSARQASGTP